MSHTSHKSLQSPQLLALRSYLQFQKQRDWQAIRQAEISPREDDRLQTHLLQGVLRHHRWLKVEVRDRCRLPWSKLQDVLKGILLIGAYELIFLRSSKQHHAIYHAVELVRLHRLEARTGLVNAILRQLQRGWIDKAGCSFPTMRAIATSSTDTCPPDLHQQAATALSMQMMSGIDRPNHKSLPNLRPRRFSFCLLYTSPRPRDRG